MEQKEPALREMVGLACRTHVLGAGERTPALATPGRTLPGHRGRYPSRIRSVTVMRRGASAGCTSCRARQKTPRTKNHPVLMSRSARPELFDSAQNRPVETCGKPVELPAVRSSNRTKGGFEMTSSAA